MPGNLRSRELSQDEPTQKQELVVSSAPRREPDSPAKAVEAASRDGGFRRVFVG